MGIKVENMSFSYGTNKIIHDICFKVDKGEMLGLLGTNGTGKTTLLKCMLDLLKNQGTCQVEGVNLRELSLQEKARYIAYVPQEVELVFPISVFEYIGMGRFPYANKSTHENNETVLEIMKEFQLEPFAFKNVNQLSGGERQRVMIARAMAQDPKVMLLDEPTSNLDMQHQKKTMEILQDIARRKDMSIIISIHDLNLAARFCDQFMIIKDTQIFSFGGIDQVINEKVIMDTYGVPVDVIIHENHKIVVMK